MTASLIGATRMAQPQRQQACKHCAREQRDLQRTAGRVGAEQHERS